MKTLSWASFSTCFSLFLSTTSSSFSVVCMRVYVCAFLYFGGGVVLVLKISLRSLRVIGYLCGDHHLSRTMALVLAGYSSQEAKYPQWIKSKMYD